MKRYTCAVVDKTTDRELVQVQCQECERVLATVRKPGRVMAAHDDVDC